MKRLIKATVVTLAFGYTILYAGSGHSHDNSGHSHAQKEVSKADVQKIAKSQLAELVKNHKVSENWAGVAISNMEKKMFNHHEEWVVSFLNENTNDKAKQTLYIFVNKVGEVTGANHSGK